MSMIPNERRPAVGLEVLGFGESKTVAVNLYTERGSGYVPLHLVPDNRGHLTRVGSSEPIDGLSGPEIKLATNFGARQELGNLVSGYIEANGWKGSPEDLRRLDLLR